MSVWKLRFAWLGWLVAFGLGLFCLVLVLQGVVRDRRIGEPVLAIDPSRPSDWTATRFRVWGRGTYMLFISSVNFDSTHAGVPLGADVEIAVLDPAGRSVFQRRYPPGTTGLTLPINYGDSQLAEVPLNAAPLRRWTLQARVLAPDERFRTARTSVKFWKQRYDPGMGGMMNYVMIVPAVLFLALAMIAAVALARHGRRVPVVLTGLVLLGCLVLIP